jgi:hypothetical protein
MAWFALARVLFVAAVAYAAVLLHPLPFSIAVNIASALGLAALVVLFESRLRETAVTHVLGALIGCTIGLGLARAIGAALFWADTGDRRRVPPQLHSDRAAVPGAGHRGKHGEWLRAGASHQPVSGRRGRSAAIRFWTRA